MKASLESGIQPLFSRSKFHLLLKFLTVVVHERTGPKINV